MRGPAIPRSRRWLRVAALATTALLFTGCGSDSGEGTQSTPSKSRGPAALEAVEIVAIDFGFRGLPEQIAPGTTLSLHNDSGTEMHELIAFRLPDDDKRPVHQLFNLPEDELLDLFTGMPDLALAARPRADSFVTYGDGTLAQPGRYLIFCGVPTGIDAAEYERALRAPHKGPPRVTGGAPHYTHGMFDELLVG